MESSVKRSDLTGFELSRKLDGIDERVLKYSRVFRLAPDFQLNSGEIVIANYNIWNKWIRARLLPFDKNTEFVKVFALDYGRQLNLPKQCIFPLLDNDLSEMAPIWDFDYSPEHSAETTCANDKVRPFEDDTKLRKIQSPTVAVDSNDRIFSSTQLSLDSSLSECADEFGTSAILKISKLKKDSKKNALLSAMKSCETIACTESGAMPLSSQENDRSDQCIDIRDVNLHVAVEETSQTYSFETDSGSTPASPNDFVPLKELSLAKIATLCIGGDLSNNFDLAKCLEKFSPHIATQLEKNQEYRLQELAWPHLLEGRSAIIIDPSDHLADLLYLPVICTSVNAVESHVKRYGPLSIIVCISQDRCVGIAKRCLSFSPDGSEADNSVCIVDENCTASIEQKLIECKILVMSIFSLQQLLNLFRKFNSVQQIVFDGVNFFSHKTFQDAIGALKPVPLQIIVASKFWKSVHAEIYAEQIKDYVIFGAPLDIAIAANTKFDVVFINRREMSQAPKQNNKLNLVLERISVSDANKFLIILDQSLPKFKIYLEQAHIEFQTKRMFVNNEYCCFNYGRKEVYFCHASTLPFVDLTISHYFIYKFIMNVSVPNHVVLRNLVEKFRAVIKPSSTQNGALEPATVSFFCFTDPNAHARESVQSFANYQQLMKCPALWANVSSNEYLPFAPKLGLEFEKNGDFRWDERHRFESDDELRLYSRGYSIKFHILHVYSPRHYKVEIFEQKENAVSPWVLLKSHSKTVEIFLAHLLPRSHVQESSDVEIFREIFDGMSNECCDADVFLKLKGIYFVENIHTDTETSFLHKMPTYFVVSRKIIDKLSQVAVESRRGSAETMQNGSGDSI